MYRGFGKYYQNISQEANRITVNWLFVLNTGGLIFVVPLSNKLTKQFPYSILVPLLFKAVSNFCDYLIVSDEICMV